MGNPILAMHESGGGPDEGARILFYSHDSWGLGHLRRSLTLASAVVEALPRSSALIATGSPCATYFSLPDGIDVLKLPAVSKEPGGAYCARTLGVSLETVVELRSRLLLEAFRGFAPHLVVVDHQVAGLGDEMLPVLRVAGELGVPRLLGLRDVIDSPEAVSRSWDSPGSRWALESGYDHVCVYGSPRVFDPRESYPMPLSLRARIWFSGYVVRPAGSHTRRPVPSIKPRVLVTTGGGEDGVSRVERYLDAVSQSPPSWETTIITGPLMEPRQMRRIKHRSRLLGGIEVRRFHADIPGLLRESDAVVAMAGYNTSAEILQSGRPAVFLPRTEPRQEQRIRAESLERLGLARSLVDPGAGELRSAIETALSGEETDVERLDLTGGARFAAHAATLLSGDTIAATARA